MRLETQVYQPEGNVHATPLLFVHGAWHSAWCWSEHFLPYFAQHGYVSFAFDLRGHGESEGGKRLRWSGISHYVSDVAQIVSELEQPPVIIGHSMGGLVVQKYLEMHQIPAAVLLASVPPSGALRTTLSIARRHPLPFLKANLGLRLYPIIGTPALTHEAFFSESMPAEQVRIYFGRMQDESYRAFIDMMILSLPRPKRVRTPVLVLGGAKDTIFTPEEVAATARAYHTDAVMFPNMAHDLMLEQGWQIVADSILNWLGEQGI